jgi:hypothetical protein
LYITSIVIGVIGIVWGASRVVVRRTNVCALCNALCCCAVAAVSRRRFSCATRDANAHSALPFLVRSLALFFCLVFFLRATRVLCVCVCLCALCMRV